MKSDNVIEVNNLKKRFKTYDTKSNKGFFGSLRRKYYWKKALQGISFTVKKGEIVLLLGRNGSGKSTLLKTITGVLYPDEGFTNVFGLNSWENRKKIAMDLGVVLGAHGQMYFDLPAMDTFDLMKHIYRIPENDFKERLNYFVEKLDLKNVYKRPVRTLSLGEQMKCNFVASLLHFPKLVILDEPTIGVDLSSKAELRETILEMRKKYKTTFLITTHMVEDVEIADRIIVIDDGKIIFEGSKPKLMKYFGDKRYIELRFINKKKMDYGKFGKVVEEGYDFLKLETNRKMLSNKQFTSLLASPSVIDYNVVGPDLRAAILKLYASAKKRR
jgi:ABC-2 type transport system ATP-binding protein